MYLSKARKKRIDYITERRLAFIPRKTFGKVLDIGCEDGSLSRRIAKRHGSQVYGLDHNPEYIKGMKGIRAMLWDINQGLPYPDEMVDLVFAGEIIEHTFDPDFFLEEIKRVLKPGGYVVITTPNLASWHNRIMLLLGIQPYGMESSTMDGKVGFGPLKRFKTSEVTGHVHLFTANALKDLFVLHGFYVEKLEGCASSFFPEPIFTLEKWLEVFPSLSSKLLLCVRKDQR